MVPRQASAHLAGHGIGERANGVPKQMLQSPEKFIVLND